jgi:hypothetical protein
MDNQEISYPIPFIGCDEKCYQVDWREFEWVFAIDRDARTLSSADPNFLILTAEDCVFLWSAGIGTGVMP